MPHPQPPTRNAQTGAITIMVALLLLVLLTISAIGMSRNAFQEVVNSGFSRQGALADNVAESGLDWAVYWLDPGNPPTSANPSAVNLVALQNTLLLNNTLEGQSWAITDTTASTLYGPGLSTPANDLKWTDTTSAGTTISEGYTAGLTRMGKLPVTGASQPNAANLTLGNSNVNAPDLWAVRADAQVAQGNVTFIHGKEAWITTPVQQ